MIEHELRAIGFIFILILFLGFGILIGCSGYDGSLLLIGDDPWIKEYNEKILRRWGWIK